VDSGTIGGLVAVGVVIVVALMMRGSRASTPSGVTRAPEPAREPWRDSGGNVAVAEDEDRDYDDDDDEDDDEAGASGPGGPHVIAVTSDGSAFVPDRHAVRLVPPEEAGEEWKVGAGMKATNLRGQAALSMSWHAGELTGARVVRGGADEGPWLMEALGRDGEYTAFVFETREGADAARDLFVRLRVVQLGEDEDGREMPPSAEQFAEARRIYHETAAALDLPDDEDAH
jgi:hypothetical protein